MSEYSGKILVKILNDGKKDLAKAILECYKDVNVNVHDTEKTSLGNTPLHIASKNGHMDIVKALLKKGANVNARNKRENTPLHIASKIGYANIVDVMVNDYNAHLNVQDNNGYTPLHYAVIGGYFKIVSTLVSKGANKKLGTYGKNGKTPLELANLNNKQGSHIKIVNLLEAKPVRDEKSHSGSKTRKKLGGGKQRRKKRATKSRKRYTGGEIYMNFQTAIYDLPIEGRNILHNHILYPNSNNNNVTNTSSFKNVVATAEKEVVNQTDINGYTPLHYAVMLNYYSEVKILKEYAWDRINVNIQDNDGNTPMHYAVINNNKNIVEELLRYVITNSNQNVNPSRVDVTIKNNHRKSPIKYATDPKNEIDDTIAHMLINKLTSIDQLYDHVHMNDIVSPQIRFNQMNSNIQELHNWNGTHS